MRISTVLDLPDHVSPIEIFTGIIMDNLSEAHADSDISQPQQREFKGQKKYVKIYRTEIHIPTHLSLVFMYSSFFERMVFTTSIICSTSFSNSGCCKSHWNRIKTFQFFDRAKYRAARKV